MRIIVLRSFMVTVFVLVLALAGCGEDANDPIPNQRTSIINYLNKDSKVYDEQGGVFRYVANAGRPSYATDIVIVKGDSVTFDFEANVFSSGPGALFYTNKAYKMAADTIINTAYWSFEPQKIKVGATPLLKGIANAIEGCREGDSVQLFITSNLAYGKNSFESIPPNTPIMYTLTIANVKR